MDAPDMMDRDARPARKKAATRHHARLRLPLCPHPPLPRGAWTRIHGGLGTDSAMLPSWPVQGDAAILNATPTLSLVKP